MKHDSRTLNGIELAFVDWGDPDATRTVVCVHGLTRNARDFDHLAQALVARGARVLAVDVVGRGRSAWLDDPGGYTVPAYAGHLSLLLADLGLTTVDWVGTSMGGLIGMVLAAAERSIIDRLVLNDVGPFIPEAALAQIGDYLGLDLRFASLDALEQHLREIHAPFGPLSDAQWRHLAEHSARQDGDGFRLNYDPRIREPFMDQLEGDVDLWMLWEQITMPTFVLRGAESRLLDAATAQAMQDRGPKAELATLAGIGHAPALMAEDQIGLVARWLDL